VAGVDYYNEFIKTTL